MLKNIFVVIIKAAIKNQKETMGFIND